MASAPRAGRRGPRAPAALFLATLLLATGLASWWTHDAAEAGPAPDVAVEGGSVVMAVPGLVRVVATGPVCGVRLSTPEGRATPRPFELEIANAGAAASVSGLSASERTVRQRHDLRVDVDPGDGWPRDITSRLPEPAAGDNWTFIAMGDPQGHDWNVRLAGELAAATGARFLLLLGDVTASGLQEQYDTLVDAVGSVGVPVYAVPGNHDAMNLGIARFVRAFGATEGSFDYGGARFALLDTSTQTFPGTEASLLSDMAAGRPAGERLVVATHIPPEFGLSEGFDPFLNPGGSSMLAAAVADAGADLLLAGHVHMYCSTAVQGGIPLVVTGGGGGVLEPALSSWSFHHLVRVEVSPGGLSWTAVPLSDRSPVGGGATPSVAVGVRGGARLDLTMSVLAGMATVEGRWTFQDRLGNWEGAGTYVGVPIVDLVALVGGMGLGGRLRVTAADGYWQEYSYANVHPDAAGQALQGRMVLAVTMDGSPPPAWDAGPRLILTPADGRYGNADAEATTEPSMEADPFSAGTRWVREVASIEVLAG